MKTITRTINEKELIDKILTSTPKTYNERFEQFIKDLKDYKDIILSKFGEKISLHIYYRNLENPIYMATRSDGSGVPIIHSYIIPIENSKSIEQTKKDINSIVISVFKYFEINKNI